jgi:hypothetical protein
MDHHTDIWDEIELASPTETLDDEMFPLISAYADGECTPTERRLVEAYLAESAAGRGTLAALRAQAAALEEGKSDPPAWLRESILAKTVQAPRWTARFPRVGKVAALASAAAAAAAVTFYTLRAPLAEVAGGSVVADSARLGIDVSGSPFVLPPVDESGPPDDDVVRRTPSRGGDARIVPAVHTPEIGLGSKTTAPRGGPAVAAGNSDAPAPSATTVEYVAQNRGMPEQPDVVAMTSESYADEPPVAATVLAEPDPREKLRERLKALNQGNKDVKAPIKGGT